MTLLRVKDLNVELIIKKEAYPVLENINFSLNRNKTLGIVGESGSGKSITAQTILRMLPDDAIVNGTVEFNGENLLGFSERQMRQIRTKEISMIFQEPGLTLNPLMRVGQQVLEAARLDQSIPANKRESEVIKMLEEVGLKKDVYKKYPHELSGGMKQRVIIAIALICNPSVIIADEPTTALDASIQSQILDLLKSVMEKRDGALLLISHDLTVIKHMCDDVLVMYAGRIVESGKTDIVLSTPKHPYTKALIDAVPRFQKRGSALDIIPFSVPSLTERSGLSWPYLSNEEYLNEYFPEAGDES
ncbi:ABC transporter ATP-binding protein [Aliicoccus persicus]|uniref:Peptide/nickel transport system ATP-binding protein/peptide/nickel transport system ATP-binding protein n=1 Tax=Aliicoccus persicus TaxID=930138 RepID=A0A662Z2S5_9STAP|nr:ABC transporter ATP-binding protein [Aliicoccus persicus]SEV95763.1 peptide/nickel transport system ATP-binding protein/peptide/nickel transport system ATP-binding protein [Aliicoccus persicus]